MKEEEIRARLIKGIEMFKEGLPCPPASEQRIEFMGWRHARRTQLDFNEILEGFVEASSEEWKKKRRIFPEDLQERNARRRFGNK